jgi:hypothetical protein
VNIKKNCIGEKKRLLRKFDREFYEKAATVTKNASLRKSHLLMNFFIVFMRMP